jgi:hypothetical protein
LNEPDQHSASAPVVLAAIAIIVCAAFTRLLPHWPNVSPIAAIAVFGGVQMRRAWAALLIPLAALFISDYIIGFHALMPAVYGAFVLIGLASWALRERLQSTVTLAAATVSSSLLFFFVTNFAVWATSTEVVYAKTFSGLGACFVAGLPFLRYSLVGDLVWVTAMFGAWRLVETMLPRAASTEGFSKVF